MTCEETAGQLAAYLDGELETAEVAAVERHVATCAACARELAEGRRLNALLDRHLATATASDLDERFSALWERTGMEPRSGRVVRGDFSRDRSAARTTVRRIAAGTLAAGLAFGLWWMGSAGNGPSDSAPAGGGPAPAALAKRAEPVEVAKAPPSGASAGKPVDRAAKKKPAEDATVVAQGSRPDARGSEPAPDEQVARVEAEKPPRDIRQRAEMFLDYSIVRRLDELENFDAVMAVGKAGDDRRS